MKNISEDGHQVLSHRIVSPDKILSTHSNSIKDLLKQISKTHNISVTDAAFAVANVMNKLSG